MSRARRHYENLYQAWDPCDTFSRGWAVARLERNGSTSNASRFGKDRREEHIRDFSDHSETFAFIGTWEHSEGNT